MLSWSPLSPLNDTDYFREGQCALRTKMQKFPPETAGDADGLRLMQEDDEMVASAEVLLI